MTNDRAISPDTRSLRTPRLALLPAPRLEPRIELPARARPRTELMTGPLFKSYWMGGFEGADHLGTADFPLSMCDLTQHRQHAAADYARLAELGIRTVRESAGWRVIDRRG